MNDFEQSSQYYTNSNNLNCEKNLVPSLTINNLEQSNDNHSAVSPSNRPTSMLMNSNVVNVDDSSSSHSASEEVIDEHAMDTSASNNLISTCQGQLNIKPYPPTSMVGLVDEHYRPYALYGHSSEKYSTYIHT
ncbi:unnamed protein product [Rotaria sp. Silwood2]|nr:unnamed protein product [Rotaria sp. Silwood2]